MIAGGNQARGEGFFAIDQRTWAHVCTHTDTNTAAAYLVLARGSGADNITTAWSVNAIQTYLELSLGRARRCLETLTTLGVVTQVHPGTRPRYKLRVWADVVPPLKQTEFQRHVLSKVRSGRPVRANDRATVQSLIRAGQVTQAPDGTLTVSPSNSDPEWVWLPNTLVTGAAHEIPPIRRVRQTQDVLTLRLLVDLYASQHLREHEGIDPSVIQQQFERVQVGQRAQYVIWGFRRQHECVTWGPVTICHKRTTLTADEQQRGDNAAVDFFRRFRRLVSLGLIEWVPHLVESDEPGAQAIHPYVHSDVDGGLERELGRAAHRAAMSMLTPEQYVWAADRQLMLVPVPAHMANVTMCGIARLTYRPHTRVTSAWYGNLHEIGQAYLETYRMLHSSEARTVSA